MPVEDDDHWLRAVVENDKSMLWDDNTKSMRPTSGAFKYDDDGVSGFLNDGLNAAGRGPKDVVESFAAATLCYAAHVGEIRLIRDDVDVEHSPNVPAVTVVDPFHALVTMPAVKNKEPGRKTLVGNLAALGHLVHGTPVVRKPKRP